MKKKILIGCGFAGLIIAALFICFFMNNSIPTDNAELLVRDFTPSKPMIKVFKNDSKNISSIDFVDIVSENKVQIRSISSNDKKIEIKALGKSLDISGNIRVYEKSDEYFKLTYMNWGVGLLAESYINEPQNMDSIFLKGPFKKGTKWSTEFGSFEITDVNVKVETPVGEFQAIEVTHEQGAESGKSYYARGIGLVKRGSEDNFFEISEIDYDVKKIKSIDDLKKPLVK